MKVEILYLSDCPNYQPARAAVEQAMRSERVTAEVADIEVCDEAMAQALAFRGSPSIRVNGVDVEPAAAQAHDFHVSGLCCRIYPSSAGSGVPSLDTIRAALRQAAADRTCHA